MKRIITILMTAGAGLFSKSLIAQDPVYSHAFMAPVYLNPAATGMSDYDFRISAVYRRQWLLVPSGMQYFTVAADKFVYEHNIGAGLMINSEQEGFIKKLGAYGSFSKLVCFGSHQLSLGLQAGVYNRRVDYGKLWFADQITNEGIVTNLPSQVSPNVNNGKWLPDFAAGAMWAHNSGWLLGAAVHHLNQPDESFTNSEESKLPRRLTLTARGVISNFPNLIWDDDVTFLGGLLYSRQRKNETLSASVEVKTHYINLGLGYRFNMDFRRSDAVFITCTIDNFLGRGDDADRTNKLRAGYAYDATTNGAGFTRTAGSSEGALVWEHLFNPDATSDKRCDANARNPIPCPTNHYRRFF